MTAKVHAAAVGWALSGQSAGLWEVLKPEGFAWMLVAA
jgi:hypothetical protein